MDFIKGPLFTDIFACMKSDLYVNSCKVNYIIEKKLFIRYTSNSYNNETIVTFVYIYSIFKNGVEHFVYLHMQNLII